MKKFTSLKTLRFLLLYIALALSVTAQSRHLLAYVSYGNFQESSANNYLEIYLKMPYGGLRFSDVGVNKYKAGLNVECYVLKSGGTGKHDSILIKDRFSIFTPYYKDSLPAGNLIDLRRYEMKPGDYRLEVYVQDYFDTLKVVSTKSDIKLSSYSEPSLSSVLLLDSVYSVEKPDCFTRNDFNYIPLVINLIPRLQDQVKFYAEFYDARVEANDKKFLELRYNLKDSKGIHLAKYSFTRKKLDGRTVPFFESFNISGLPSGDYILSLEIYRDGQMLAQKETGLRIPEKTGRSDFVMNLSNAQIKAFLPNLFPVLENKDMDQYDLARRQRDSMALKDWFFGFWESRNPQSPARAYYDYLEQLKYVKAAFSTMLNKSGVGSDRGKTYLKYGKPDNIIPYDDEPTAFPYEIWQYYHLQTQSNVKFVFCNPTGIDNEYRLIHSDLRSEVSNPNWKKEIYRRTNKNTNIDQNNQPNDWGNHLNDRLKEIE